MKKLLVVFLIGLSISYAEEAKSMTDAELLNSEWQKAADVETDTVFVRSIDSQNAAQNGAWVRRIHKNGEEDTIEHYLPTSCDGVQPIIRDVKITVSDADGTFHWKKKNKTMKEHIAKVLRENIFCPTKKQQVSSVHTTESTKESGDFTTVEYLSNGTGGILDNCSGKKIFTTFEQVTGKAGGYTFIAACQTEDSFAEWLATKRESFVLTAKGKQATETFYRIGKNCKLIDAGGTAKKWDCQSLENVNMAKINTVEPITDANKDNYFAPIWVKAK